MNQYDWPEHFLEDWQAFFATESERPAGLDSYDDIFRSPCAFPLQRRRELERMIRIARKVEPRVVVDIGTDKCGGLYHWCKCFSTVERVVSIELRGCPCSALFEQHFPTVDFLWIADSSYSDQTVRRVVQFLADQAVDVLFIDGDKGATMHDFATYSPIVRKGGVVFIHDINEPGHPRETFDELAKTYSTERIVDTTESEEAMERQERYVPIDTAYETWLRYWCGRSAGVGVLYMK